MKIPDAILGAILALSGVLMTLISTHINEWVKSSRERKHTQKQRELSLKREIYLPLVEAFTEGVTLFTSIPGAHHSKISELTLSRQSQNALAAKDLFGNNAVMIAVNTAAKHLAQGVIRLMALKLDEAILSIDLENLDTRINGLNSYSRLIIDRMGTLREAGILSKDMALELDSEFKNNDTKLHNLFKEQKNTMGKKNEIMQNMQVQMMKEISGLTAVSAYAVIEMRIDLEIPTDKEVILANYRDSIGFIDEYLPGFIDDVWKKVIHRENELTNGGSSQTAAT